MMLDTRRIICAMYTCLFLWACGTGSPLIAVAAAILLVVATVK